MTSKSDHADADGDEVSADSLTTRARDRVRHYRHVAERAYANVRRRSPAFDHLVRAVERYGGQNGNTLAASVTYFGFLSFFPLIALAFSALGYISFMDDQAREALRMAIQDLLPGLGEQLPIEAVEQARLGAGIIGLLGLLYSGLGAVSALREALRAMWLKSLKGGPNFLVAKVVDTAIMLVVGVALLASVALTSTAQAGTHWLLSQVGLEQSLVAAGLTRALGLAIAVAADTVIFLVLFSQLSGARKPWWMLWRGALLAACGFELLKLLATFLLRGTLDNPVYASFAVLVGLLVWINLVTRVLLFAAAWTATTGPSGSDSSTSPIPVLTGGVSAARDTAAGSPSSVPLSERRSTPKRGFGALGLGLISYAVWRRLWDRIYPRR